MNKKLLSLAIAGAIAMPLGAQAGTLTVANQDITLSGGIAGGYIYNTEASKDAFTVNDALLDIAKQAKTGGVGFDLGVGALAEANLASTIGMKNSVGSGTNTTTVQYGWLSVLPLDGLEIDAGRLATNVGHEAAESYANDNILRGLVWNNEPVFYNGARASYTVAMGSNSINVYGEVSKFDNSNSPASGIGASGTFGGITVALNDFNVAESNATKGTGDPTWGNLLNLMVSGKVSNFTYGASLDYLSMSDAYKKAITAPTNQGGLGITGIDDNAFGLALYGSMAMGNFSLPIRVEYVDDAKSGLYGLTTFDQNGNLQSNTAITFTITPTYNFSNSTFVRAELAYVSTDKKGGIFVNNPPYVDDKGVATDSTLTLGLQAGLKF